MSSIKILILYHETSVRFENDIFRIILSETISRCGLDIEIHEHCLSRDCQIFGEELAKIRLQSICALTNPHVIIVSQYWTAPDFPVDLALSLRENGVKFIYQMWDTPLNYSMPLLNRLGVYDVVLFHDSVSAVYFYSVLSSLAGHNIQFMSTVGLMCEEAFSLPTPQPEIDFVFAGSIYGDLRSLTVARLQAVAEKNNYSFKHIGGLNEFSEKQTWASWSNYFSDISKGRIAVSAPSYSWLQQVRHKPFEYIMGGAFPVTERHFDTQMLFPDDTVALYSDPDELEALLITLMRQPQEIERRRRRTHAWWRDMNDWRGFWRQTIATLLGFGDGYPRRPCLAPFEARFAPMRAAFAAALGPAIDRLSARSGQDEAISIPTLETFFHGGFAGEGLTRDVAFALDGQGRPTLGLTCVTAPAEPSALTADLAHHR